LFPRTRPPRLLTDKSFDAWGAVAVTAKKKGKRGERGLGNHFWAWGGKGT